VHAAKYQGDFASLGLLAYLLRRAVTAHREPAPDLLLPMPLHWWRRRRRGFNQAQELARMLTRHPALADLALAPGLARRTRATASQRQLDARERQRNLRGAFRVEPAVAGKTVAIVDDVLTTGASADALARALKAAGAATVSVWCCARTPEPG
jgi:ComF family protein